MVVFLYFISAFSALFVFFEFLLFRALSRKHTLSVWTSNGTIKCSSCNRKSYCSLCNTHTYESLHQIIDITKKLFSLFRFKILLIYNLQIHTQNWLCTISIECVESEDKHFTRVQWWRLIMCGANASKNIPGDGSSAVLIIILLCINRKTNWKLIIANWKERRQYRIITSPRIEINKVN